MKRLVVTIGLTVAALILTSCQSTTVVELTRFTLSNEAVRIAQDTETKHTFWVTVSAVPTDENNRAANLVLADGPLVDGELLLSQRVAEPTRVLISIKLGIKETERRLFAVLKPNAEINFVLNYHNPKYYSIDLIGADHRSLDPDRKFSLTGDISGLAGVEPNLQERIPLYVSVIERQSIFDDSDEAFFFLPSLLLDDGKFSIDGDIDEPIIVTISIRGRNSPGISAHAILEPGVNFSVVPLGNSGKLAVQADRDSVQSRLMSSWQLDPAFVSLLEQRMDSRTSEGGVSADREEHVNDFVSSYQIADECDHVNMTNENKSEFVGPIPSAYQTLGNEIVTKRSTSIRKMLRDTQDSELARMIFNLNWILLDEGTARNVSVLDERITTLLELVQKVDQEIVDQFITPRVDEIKRFREQILNSRTLLPGHLAPEISLNNIAGDKVSLSKVLEENELVLVDFWASWCGPCIESFPALKKMYSKFKDRGFEILTISLDDTVKIWTEASESHNLPWIDLGDPKTGDKKIWNIRPSQMDYGVLSIPSTFLIDNKGCILDKHFSDVELKEMLSSRLAGVN